MRLIWISFALLLYVNLAHAVDVDVIPSDGTDLAPAPVDNIHGRRCSFARSNLVDASKELRESNACKPGKEGLVKHSPYLTAFIFHHDRNKKNKPYLCCIDPIAVCINANGDLNGTVEVITTEDEYRTKWPTTAGCSATIDNPKPCQNPKDNFCLPEVGNDANHYLRTRDATRMENWKDLPVCCPKFYNDKTCNYAKYIEDGPTVGVCEKNFGRCKSDDHTSLCSKKKHDKTASSCCRPGDSELCPGGIYPFGLKGKNGLVDWIAGNSGDSDAWNNACLNLSKTPEFAGATAYIFNEKCCAKAKLNEAAYYGKDFANLLSDQYDRFSTKDCKNDADCGEGKFCGTATSSYKNEPATGKACFDKIQCPDEKKTVYPVLSTENSFICTVSSTCPTGTICVKGKPAAATSAKVKKSFGMCCPKKDETILPPTTEKIENPASQSLHLYSLLMFLPLLE